MKKWIFMLLLAGSIQGVYAQKTEKKDKFNPNTPLFEELTDVKKKTDKFNLYLNMQGSFDAHFQNGFQEGDFNMHQLRIEAKGNINNWLSYRYRQRRLNRCRFLLRCKNRTGMRLCKESLLQSRLRNLPEGCLR